MLLSENTTFAINDMKPMPCQSCGMYKYFNISYINSWFYCGFTQFTFSCDNCYEKHTLAQQIVTLKQTIANLNDRVSSLIDIRNAETSFDRTVMDALTNQFANVDINHTPQVFTDTSAVSSTAQSDYTSIWVGDTDTCLDSTGISHVLGNRGQETLFSTINNDSGNNDFFEETGNISSLNKSSGNIDLPEVATPELDHQPNPNETTWCTTDGENDRTEQKTPDVKESTECATPFSPVTNADLHVKLIIAGDKGIKDIKLKPEVNYKNSYKVSHRAPTIKQSSECVSYLVEKRFKNTEFVLYQVGSDTVAKAKSEDIKQQLDKMAESLQSRDVQLIVSGPVPSTTLKTEAFSRMVAFENWLMKWAAPRDVMFVSNFDLFWRKRHLFNRDGTLNETGASFLSDNIRFSLEAISDVSDIMSKQ